MNKKFLLYITPLILSTAPMHYAFSVQPNIEAYEHKKVASIKIKLENLPPGVPFNSEQVLAKLSTKTGDPFSQNTFDQDLKALSQEYDRTEPSVEIKNGEIYITIRIWQKPIIRQIKFIHKKI